MVKPIAHATAALALSGVLTLAGPARAEEPMQVSGIDIVTQVESHVILAGDQAHSVGVDKYVGAVSSPGWFDSMQATFTATAWTDLKLGRSEAKGALFWRNSEGALIGSYVIKVAFTIDPKTSAPKGTLEGTWEIADGTDRFANVRGHGTVKGEFNGVNGIDHWSGTITGFDKRA